MATVVQPNPNQPSGSNAMATLYVGDLHPDVTEAILFTKFQECGQVLSIRVCRDMLLRKSLGYAYVNFQSSSDAESALDRLNFDVIKGRPIRIMWSQRDPSLRKSGIGNIFIKNLGKDIVQKDLYDTFVAFGNILSCKIATDELGMSKGYGFIHFETEESANAAIKAVHSMVIRGKTVFVARFVPRVQRPDEPKNREFTNCFVKNFGAELNDEGLVEMFSTFGKISSAKVMIDESGVSRGFGFVCFNDAVSAASATSELNGATIGDKAIQVCRAQKKAERAEELRCRFEKQKIERTSRYALGVNLYVKNLDDTIDDARLLHEFAGFGEITSSKVMCDINRRSKGFGFVCFANPEQATKAVSEMNGKIIVSKPLYVALAQRKEDRKVHLQSQFMHRGGVGQYQAQNAQMQSAISTMLPPGGPPPTNVFPIQMQHPQQAQAMNQAQRFYANPAGGLAQVQGLAARSQPRWHQQMPSGQAAYGQSFQAARVGHMAPLSQMQSDYSLNQMRNAAAMGVPQAQMQSSVPTGNPNVAGMPSQLGSRPITGGQQQRGQMAPQPGRPTMASVVGGVPQQAPVVVPGIGARQITGQQHTTTAGLSPLDASALAAAPVQDQKQMLGERLYPLVRKIDSKLAGKITGMLLEIDNADLMYFLESEKELTAKVNEAIEVLSNSGGAARVTAAPQTNGLPQNANGEAPPQFVEPGNVEAKPGNASTSGNPTDTFSQAGAQ